MSFSIFRWTIASAIALAVVGCSDGSDSRDAPPVETPTPADANAVFAVANGCYSISPDAGNKFIGAAFADDTYTADITDVNVAGRFLLRPSDLGKYLVYDQDRGYLVSDGQGLLRQMSLTSDTNEVDGTVVIEDRMQSEGEWQLLSLIHI